LSREIYVEVLGDVVGCLSRGLGVSEEKIMSILGEGEKKEEKKDKKKVELNSVLPWCYILNVIEFVKKEIIV
jgi:hypothetical protein